MKMDTIRLIGGIDNSLVEGQITNETHERISAIFEKISKQGDAGREECDYQEFLVELSKIDDIPVFEAVPMWRELGRSIAASLMVSNTKN